MSLSGRSDAVDIVRALALTTMAAYHFTWDLTAFGFLPASLPFTSPMRFASHAIATTFLALVGLSLALAHRDGPRWRAFFRRVVVVAAAAGLVSVVSLYAEPQAPIGFGILHCIAAASLLAAPLLPAPFPVAILVGIAAIAAPYIVSSPLFDPPWLVWTGLGAQEPLTVDWRPLLPWGGVVWLSFGLARGLPAGVFASAPFVWRAVARPARAAAWLGRHSLAFYLLHQPALYGLAFAAASLTGIAEIREREAILAQCRPACVEAGGAPEPCDRACACLAEGAIGRRRAGLGLDAHDAGAMASACSASTR